MLTYCHTQKPLRWWSQHETVAGFVKDSSESLKISKTAATWKALQMGYSRFGEVIEVMSSIF